MDMTRQFELRNLAKLFEQHKFFCDELPKDESYGLLIDVYSCLTQESKDYLLKHYDMLRRRRRHSNDNPKL